MSDTKITQVEFKGKASEYFGIWIVNLLLTLLTLGIYSAWAKVRRKKYFYNNTLIENVGFDYHAKPLAILKGRIIAFVVFLAYAFSGQFNFFFPMAVALLVFLALPWLVVRSSIFNARNTSHRGLRFDFIGKTGEAFRVFVLLPIMAIFTLYFAWPYADHQRNKFMVNHHQFGLSQFALKAKVSSFYKVYAILLIFPFLIGILAAIAIPAYHDYVERAKEATEQRSAISVPFAAGFVDVAHDDRILLAVNETTEDTYRVERVYSDNEDVEAVVGKEAQPNKEEAVYSDNEEPVMAEDQSFEAQVKESQRIQKESRDRMIADVLSSPLKALYGLGFVLGYLTFIFTFVAYFKSRIGNLVWNNTTLDGLSFTSSLRARDYLWIYVTNIIAIALTFGLATPWAQVRLARYRASKLQMVGDVDFDQFVGDKKEQVKATGEEIADFFDVDFSFG